MELIISGIQEALIIGDAPTVKEKTEQALAMGILPKKIIQQGLFPGMSVVGTKFKIQDMGIPEVLMVSRAMHAGLYVLQPHFEKQFKGYRGSIALGTVGGDLHDIGKNLVKMTMEAMGFQVIDLGIDIPPHKFVDAVKEHQPNIIGLSSLVTTTMGEMAEVIFQLKHHGLREQIKVLVGGAPITPEFAENIGADGYAKDCFTAVQVAHRLVNGEIGFIAM